MGDAYYFDHTDHCHRAGDVDSRAAQHLSHDEKAMSQAEEIDPFIKRVVTVHSDDVVIFRITRPIEPDQIEGLRAKLETKMGPIPFIVIGPEIDLTVLKQPSHTQVHIA